MKTHWSAIKGDLLRIRLSRENLAIMDMMFSLFSARNFFKRNWNVKSSDLKQMVEGITDRITNYIKIYFPSNSNVDLQRVVVKQPSVSGGCLTSNHFTDRSSLSTILTRHSTHKFYCDLFSNAFSKR